MQLIHKKIFISGGAGFIGTALTRRLIKNNEVVIFDNFHRDSISSTSLTKDPRVTIINGDVTDNTAIKKSLKECQFIIHLAAIAGVDTVMKNPVTTMKVSLIGTYNMLEAAMQQEIIERFVDFSTSEVFGTYAYRVKEGDSTTLGAVGEARWTYAVSKLATEHMAFNYFKQYNLPTVSIRPFNIYGPGQVGEGAIHHFILKAIKGEDLIIHNDGGQIRSWCYIDDIVEAVMAVLIKYEAVGNAFNIGNPRSTITIHNLAKEIIRLSNSKSEMKHVDWNFPDVELRIPNVDKAKKLLDFSPKVDLEEGLLKTIKWYKDRNSAE